MSITYKRYPESQYIILSDGSVARLIKETKIHQQTYYNLIINKKMKRVNKSLLLTWFDSK